MSRLHYRDAALWLDQAFDAVLARPLLYLGSAALLLVLRWSVDLFQMDNASAALILFSYFTDSLIFASVWLALAEPGQGLAAGWKALAGRRWKTAGAGLWGLPSAAIGYLLLSLGPVLFEALGALAGPRLAGWLMLGWIFAVGWICCLALFAAILAALACAQGETRLWRAGMIGLRAVAHGWRPLLGIWSAFVCGATLFALLSAGILGHSSYGSMDELSQNAMAYWINWPALFLAVVALLALLRPAGLDLLGAAEREAELSPAAFGETMARRLAWALTALAVALAASAPFVIDLELGQALTGALALWVTSRALNRAAPAWSDPESSVWARWRWLILIGLPALLLWLSLATASGPS